MRSATSAGMGYLRVYIGRENPAANATGHAYVHRLVMSEHIGRPLFPEETVHHKNVDKHDNRIENLELWSKNHGPGQRVSDIVQHIVERYPHLVMEALRDRPSAQLQ